uniref:Orn_Arg_deC_N domain-containing protein n=1 Tax=Macrostomum lignano TaxID=282301 RepID=A0A1I8GZH3_9PLAT
AVKDPEPPDPNRLLTDHNREPPWDPDPTTDQPMPRVFASQIEACAWLSDQLPADCQSASLLDLAALWRARASLLASYGDIVATKLTTRIDAHAASGLTGALAQLGCGGRVRARNDLTSAISSGLTGPNLLLDNPCKTRSLINLAKRHSVAMTTFDNETEAARLAEQWPGVSALLLVRPEGADSLGDATLGAEPGTVASVLAAAKSFGLNVVGVSVVDCAVGAAGVLESARVAISAGRLLGHRMSLLDIGTNSFLTAELNYQLFEFIVDNKIDALMTDSTDALLSRSIVLATRLVAKQRIEDDAENGNSNKGDWRCTVGDSAFGGFSGWRLQVGIDNVSMSVAAPELLGVVRSASDFCDAAASVESDGGGNVWMYGVTDSTEDRLGCLRQFGLDCDIGDWLLWSGLGAQDSRAARKANGLAEPEFRCFLQSGREPTAPIGSGGSAKASSSAPAVRSRCRTRHSSSCCYSETVSINASSVGSGEQSSTADREICSCFFDFSKINL